MKTYNAITPKTIRSRQKSVIRVAALLLAIILVMSSCKKNGGADGKAPVVTYENTIHLLGYNFESLNPLDTKNAVNRDIFSLIYQGAYKLDPYGKPIPVLASGAVCSNNGLEWEITFKSGITFHNGTPFSAKDFVYTVKYIFANETRYSYNVKDIYSIRAISADKAAITLSEPSFNFCANLIFPVIPESGFGETGFNGTGPFKVTEYVQMKKMKLIRTGAMPQKGVAAIEVQFVPDSETAHYAAQSGVCDIFLSEDIAEAASDVNKSEMKTLDFVSENFGYLLINSDNEIFKDINVRKAMNLVIDRREITENILFSKALVTDTPIFGTYYLSDGKEAIEADKDAAKQILTDSGYEADVTTGIMEKTVTVAPEETEDGAETEEKEAKAEETKKISLQFEILVNEENGIRMQIADSIIESLKYTGINATLCVTDFEDYNTRIAEGNYDCALCLMEMGADNDFGAFAREGGISGFGNSKSDEALNMISATENTEEKKNGCALLKKWFNSNIPVISLYYTKSSLQYSDKIIGGIYPTPFNILNNIENWEIK